MRESIRQSIDTFYDAGYVVLPNVLSNTQLIEANRLGDDLWAKYRDLNKPTSKLQLDGERIAQHDFFIKLCASPVLLNLALEIMGWNIQVGHLELTFNPTQGPEKLGMDWHQDGGRINFDLANSNDCRMTLRMAIWLTNGSQEGLGTFYAIPGSHNWEKKKIDDRDKCLAQPILLNAGDAIIFDRRLWHSRRANRSPTTRRVIFLDYSHRWMESKCSFLLSQRQRDQLTPVEKQLFDRLEDSGMYPHATCDIPLKKYALSNNILC